MTTQFSWSMLTAEQYAHAKKVLINENKLLNYDGANTKTFHTWFFMHHSPHKFIKKVLSLWERPKERIVCFMVPPPVRCIGYVGIHNLEKD